MTPARTKIVAIAALCATTAVASLVGLISVNTGASVGTGPFAVGSTDGYENRAYNLLVDSPSPAAIDEAEVLAKKALAVSPYDNTARLRLVYIASLRQGALSPRAVELFVQSYDLLPTDQNVAAWRIRFALEHWTELSPQARALVHDEVVTFADAGSVDPPVRQILGSIRNPSGRLAAALWLHGLDS